MYLVALLKSLLTVLLITATFFSGTNGTRHLSQRARIQMNQGVNPVLVGPANPPPTCVGTLGKPLLSDCREIVRSFSQVGGDAGFPPELRSRRSTLLREYYERGTSPRYQNQFRQLQVQLPIYKQVGTCVGKLQVVSRPHYSETSDRATWQDVANAISPIMRDCLTPGQGPLATQWSGGLQRFGDANGLFLALYASDSLYADDQDTDSECSDTPDVVTQGLACQPRGNQRPRPDFGSSNDDADSGGQRPAQRPRICSSDTFLFEPVFEYYSEDENCCGSPSYKWTSLTIFEALERVLFGFGNVVEQAIGICGAISDSS